MKEGIGSENSLHSYPVKVISTRIDWILNTESGKLFLQALHQQQNLDYYNILFVKTLVEFMYKKIKTKNQTSQKIRLILFIILFFLTVIFNENYHSYEHLHNNAKSVTKQFFKFVAGTLFWLNMYELRTLLIKIKIYSIDYEGITRSILYE